MKLMEKTLESDVVYQGAFFTVRKDRAELPNGRTAQREVVEHPGAVAVLPLDGSGNVIAVEQYRYAPGKVMLEVPAGKLERGEDHRACALRELEEETGLIPDELTYLGNFYVSPGYCSEEIYLYLARGLRQGVLHPDEDEFLELRKVPFHDLVDSIMKNEVHDAKTIAAVLMTKVKLEL